MKLEHYPLEKLKKEIGTIIERHLNISDHRVFFFGSRVRGKGSDRSDIDIGIEGPRPIPGYILETIREELENLPTLYKIDLVDFKSVAIDFKSVALKQTESIL